MKNALANSFSLACLLLVAFLVGCAQNISVQFPAYTAAGNGSQLAKIPPQKIHFKGIQDLRTPGRAEGSREAAFGVPMGDVEFHPPAPQVISDMLRAEFQNAGATLTDQEQPITLSGKVLTFEVGTDTTPLYWDIIGNIKIQLEVSSKSGTIDQNTYSATCKDRTYVWPSGSIIKDVMQNCINDLGRDIRNDEGLAKAIMNK